MTSTFKIFSSAGTVLSVVLSINLALAQTAPTTKTGAPVVNQPAALSVKEKLARAALMKQGAAQASARVSQMLSESRGKSDIIRVNCLDDKLAQIHANQRTVDDRYGAIQSAAASNDGDRVNHEFTVMGVVAKKIQSLQSEANQCIGKDMYDSRASNVSVVINPNFLPLSGGAGVVVPPPTIAPSPVIPPPASPFI
jgi:hypothetical protein